jgi:hypothetical protein
MPSFWMILVDAFEGDFGLVYLLLVCMAEIDSSNTRLWKTPMNIVVHTDYQPQLVVPSEVGEV